MTHWIMLVFGLWMIISPWVLGAATSPLKWSNIIVGLITTLLAFWGLFREEKG
jgi:hypothetical protein